MLNSFIYREIYIESLKEHLPHKLEQVRGGKVSVYEWWLVDKNPDLMQLKELALIVFSLPCSSATCERTFSTMGFIHNKLRNRLSDLKVMKLLYVHINMKQLEKKRKADHMPDSEDEEVDFSNGYDQEIDEIDF